MNSPSGSSDAFPLLNNIYIMSLSENERNVRFWEDYLKSLRDLDFNAYSSQLKVPILVPVGNRILFKGDLKHTNEVTVALGADYFVKCSVKQAEVLRQHRIKDAETKLNHYKKEREYLESKLEISSQYVFAKTGEEIMEPFNEDEDKTWREKHRENIRKYKQNKCTVVYEVKPNLTDEELWERLEELELKEELENEFESMKDNDKIIQHPHFEKAVNIDVLDESIDNKPDSDEILKRNNFGSNTVIESSEDILQKVLEKQSELEHKLLDLKNRERVASKTEDQLMSRLDELEQLDELEDDIDRLDDILYNNEDNQPTVTRKCSVTFADDNDSETIDITFNHSEVNPDFTPYDTRRGICKPSDVYDAFPQLCKEVITSILKKTDYDPSINSGNCLSSIPENEIGTKSDTVIEGKPIEIKDVKEHIVFSENASENLARPPSLFKLKKRRLKCNALGIYSLK